MSVGAISLGDLPLFQGVRDDEIPTLIDGASLVNLEPDQVLFRSGQEVHGVYLIRYGNLKLLKATESGHETILRFFGRGELLGALLVGPSIRRYPATAIALDMTLVHHVPRRTFMEKWLTHPILAERVQEQIRGRMVDFHLDKAMSQASIPQRLAEFLLRTLNQQSPAMGNKLALKLTRQEIADRVGTRVETVIRIFSSWSKQGLISASNQQIAVLDRDAIRKILVNGP